MKATTVLILKEGAKAAALALVMTAIIGGFFLALAWILNTYTFPGGSE